MRELLLDEVRRSVKTAFPDVGDDLLQRLQLELPRDPSHGDYATNAAFLLKDVVRDNPRKIAEALVDKIAGGISDAEVAGPGFINFRIRPEGIHSFLRKLADPGARAEMMADPELAKSVGKFQIEFVSANPTGPMNVVSARAAAFGDATARLMRAVGCDVTAEYYVNDEGNQARLFGESLKARYLQAAGHGVEFPEDGYRGDYVTEFGEELHRAVMAWTAAGKPMEYLPKAGETIADIVAAAGEPPETETGDIEEAVETAADELPFAELGLRSMIAAAKKALAGFGVEFDVWFRESALHAKGDDGRDRVQEAEDLLRERGHVREEEGALWFTSTEFGDDKDRVIRRSGGVPTYLLADIAYHLDKVRRGFDRVVDVWGPDHHGYIKRLHSATVALGQPEEWLEVTLVQQVNLLRDGEPVKMSKRGGEFVTLDELVEEVGKDVSRFFFLMRRASTHLDFDLELAKKESMENPVYYVNYAHARSRSIFRQPMAREVLGAAGGDPGAGGSGAGAVDLAALGEAADLARLTTEEETAMMRTLLQYPQTVQEAAAAREPHRLVAYLREVAGTYHRFYTSGRNDASARVLTEDHDTARARLFLVGVLADVLREGLGLLGIEAVDHM